MSEPISWMTEVTTIENFTPKRCMTSMPGNARSMPAIEKTPMIWDSISTDIPRSAPMYWIAGAALNWLNVAVNPKKNSAAKHIHRSLGFSWRLCTPNVDTDDTIPPLTTIESPFALSPLCDSAS